jgi:hypothetical protein
VPLAAAMERSSLLNEQRASLPRLHLFFASFRPRSRSASPIRITPRRGRWASRGCGRLRAHRHARH